MPLAADSLTLVPHIAAVYLAWRGRPVWSGAMAGVAFLFNAKALFVLVACAGLAVPFARAWLLAGFAIPNTAVLALAGSRPARSATTTSRCGGSARSMPAAPLWQSAARRRSCGPPTGRASTRPWLRPRHGSSRASARPRAGRSRFGACWHSLRSRAAGASSRAITWRCCRSRRSPPRAAWCCSANGAPRSCCCCCWCRWRASGRATPCWRAIWPLAASTSGAMSRWTRRAAPPRRFIARARPGDTLFVWGYRPDMYVYTGMPAATRFLESQPLSGVFADRHLFETAGVAPAMGRATSRRARALAARRSSLTGWRFSIPRSAITAYPDLRPWLAQYEEAGPAGAAIIYTQDRVTGYRDVGRDSPPIGNPNTAPHVFSTRAGAEIEWRTSRGGDAR